MASAALCKLSYYFGGDDITHMEKVINLSHKRGHFRLQVQKSIIHLIQLSFLVVLQQTFCFLNLEFKALQEKKKKKQKRRKERKDGKEQIRGAVK